MSIITDLEFNSWWKSVSYIHDVDQAYLQLWIHETTTWHLYRCKSVFSCLLHVIEGQTFTLGVTLHIWECHMALREIIWELWPSECTSRHLSRVWLVFFPPLHYFWPEYICTGVCIHVYRLHLLSSYGELIVIVKVVNMHIHSMGMECMRDFGRDGNWKGGN